MVIRWQVAAVYQVSKLDCSVLHQIYSFALILFVMVSFTRKVV